MFYNVLRYNVYSLNKCKYYKDKIQNYINKNTSGGFAWAR